MGNHSLLEGSLFKNIWRYSIPLMVTNLLQTLFNTADTIVVGKFAGDAALAAVGGTGTLTFLFTCLFTGLSVGSNVVIAREIGAQKDERVHRGVSTSIILGFFGGLILIAGGYLLSKPFLLFMNTPESILQLGILYLRIYFCGSIFVCIYNFGAAILRAKGDTRRPLIYLLISGGINVILNLILVIVFHLGVAGVAIATVISQAISCLLCIVYLLKERYPYQLDLKDLVFDGEFALEISRIGIPAAIQSMAFSLSNVVVQASINSFDSDVIIAANTAANSVENFIYIGMTAFSNATITFVSQLVGANQKKRVSEAVRINLFSDVFCALFIGTLTLVFGRTLLSLYTDSEIVIETGMSRLFWVAFLMWINGALDIYVNAMRGLGYSTLPTIVMMVGIIGVRLSWLYVYFPMHRTLQVVYMCYPLSWTVTLVISFVMYQVVYRKYLLG